MIRKVLVPVDGSDYSVRAVEFASDIAARFGASITFVQVLSKLPARKVLTDYLSRLEAEQEPNEAEIDSIRDALAKSGEVEAEGVLAQAKQIAASRGVPGVTAEILDGDPAIEILGFAADFDLIVMGRRGLGGLRGLLMGSVTQKVSSMAVCPVVTVG